MSSKPNSIISNYWLPKWAINFNLQPPLLLNLKPIIPPDHSPTTTRITVGVRFSRSTSRASSHHQRDNSGSHQFNWASTQNIVHGHCNRCGIGHLPTQCPNQPTP